MCFLLCSHLYKTISVPLPKASLTLLSYTRDCFYIDVAHSWTQPGRVDRSKIARSGSIFADKRPTRQWTILSLALESRGKLASPPVENPYRSSRTSREISVIQISVCVYARLIFFLGDFACTERPRAERTSKISKNASGRRVLETFAQTLDSITSPVHVI